METAEATTATTPTIWGSESSHGESILRSVVEMAWQQDWDSIRTLMNQLLNNNNNNNVAAIHPGFFCELLQVLLFAGYPAALEDLLSLMYDLNGKHAFYHASHYSGMYPLHALVSSSLYHHSSRHVAPPLATTTSLQQQLHAANHNILPTVFLPMVRFMGRVAPETAHLRDSRHQRPIDIVCRRLLQLQDERQQRNLSCGPVYHLYHNYMSARQQTADDEFLWTCAYHLVRMMMIATDDTDDAATETNATNNDGMMLRTCLRARHVLPPPFLQLVLEKYVDQLVETDAQGNLPLHVLLSSAPAAAAATTTHHDQQQQQVVEPCDEKAVLQAVLAGYPYAASVENASGKLPLQLAMEAGRPYSDLQELMDCSPDSLLAVLRTKQPHQPRSDVVDRLVLNKLCQPGKPFSATAVFCLLQNNPNMIGSATEEES